VVSDGTVTRTAFDPAALGIPRATAADLRGGDAAANAEVVRELVGGKPGPVRDAVLINAAAALAAFSGFSGSLEDDLRAGLAKAAEAIDSGAAAALLDRWIAFG
jgi:anthranilate phosphoribosyltransferase